ncbi:uncharacterized protein NECHADRAFT_86094 [Fusarium vanettenii 77-13-4]|uniref:AAA+ ATPase domain-containing protein n=1 Tax=Fusarium vanettenii (strain ATCC MYA-4622 / CBS 123669 / FGSC 9596 / NRRL 45880 / 77-13-4) TaxID=660122 RepID=C7Z2B5_FUSV7|nr:uncharacterized protein NECHADRAFT_86094 [Fusarium vanettenii 77-13-4]EEU42144.1 hypothetical protein NECHADRAFT_86094 [Fusarium vanettenii 77-13-4]
MADNLPGEIPALLAANNNTWQPFPHGNQQDEPVPGPGTYYLQGGPNQTPAPEGVEEVQASHWFRTRLLTENDISQLTSLQLITHSHNRNVQHDDWAGVLTWFELAIHKGNSDEVKKLPSGQSLAWFSHRNWFGVNEHKWCRGRMFTKDDEIFQHLKIGDSISVRMSAGPHRRNHASEGYLALGFGRAHQTPTLPADQPPPIISVYAQKRQECFMVPADVPSKVEATIIHDGIDLMGRLLKPQDNDWTVRCHPLPPVHQPTQEPDFDSTTELTKNEKGTKPSLRVVKQSTINWRLQSAGNNNVPQDLPPRITVWDDSGVEDNAEFAIREPHGEVLIYQMHAPLWTGALWDKIIAPPEQQSLSTILVIDADDLRANEIRISRGISWEKTMEHLRSKLARITFPMPQEVKERVHLLVRCGYEGVLHVPPSTLGADTRPFVFHMVPDMAEGDLLQPYQGRMPGIHLAFVSGLAASLAREPVIAPETMGRTQVGTAIELAIIWSHRFATVGFCKDINGGLNYPKAKSLNNYQASKTKIIYCDRNGMADDGRWSLFRLPRRERRFTAAEVVNLGTKYLDAIVPTALFGKLKAADRTEIEGYRSTAAVVHEYLRCKTDKPLSIAVFGQPGAGKSFGIKEVMKALVEDFTKKKCEPIEANLSQFLEYSDLVGIFRNIRDKSLKGEIPVVLFDEFDSALHEKALGWLKYFLAPMQDGQFLDAGVIRALGRAIFIFIGGTSSTFKNFKNSRDEPPPNDIDPDDNENLNYNDDDVDNDEEHQPDHNDENNQDPDPDRVRQDRQAKKPDFVSRLSAHIDIKGPNRVRPNRDRMFIVRRAILLASMLKRRFDVDVDRLNVHGGVTKALLNHGRYPHGTRSMELILQTSRLSGRNTFETSALASDDQLIMHVRNTDPFHFLVDHGPMWLPDFRPIDVDLYIKWMWARMQTEMVPN